ncbi:MAG: DEAD/DEAH box helicase [Candidatus Bathyarchaeia archaeon]|jgi:ATP-dependent Lhr-like helicase
MQTESSSSVFELLARPVRKALVELGFSEPTLPQTLAFPPVLEGKNVLLIAPTGTGKTEAVLLPIFSKLVEQKNQEQKGMQVIYITPLRALNRDMLKRLTFWSQRLDITVEVRHGDTEMKIRRKQARQPPQVLVTTPETLQAILPGSQMRKHLGNVQCVIIDEVHDLAESKRGAQLTIALERIFEVTGKEFQRIGLSATVGNPRAVARFIAGTNREISIVQAVLAKNYRYRVEYLTPIEKDYDLAAKLETSPEASARIRRLTELIDTHKSTLVFVNSRTIAELLGHRFDQLNRADIAVHHGSLSREERVSIEDAFKSGRLKAIICTSTLELGVDIGNVDLVIQYMSPRQVGSLIQRVGRSGHSLERLSEGVILTAFPDDTLESMAAVENAKQNRIEPVLFHKNALDVLAHQVAGVLMDKENISQSELLKIVNRAYPYSTLTLKKLQDVTYFLESLRKLRLDEEGKLLRKTGRTREYYYSNLSMIPDEKRYPVINVLNDRKIGTLGDEFMTLHARVGLNFIMRGKVWRIVQIQDETGTVHVVPTEDPSAAVPGWDGEILPVPFDLAQQTGEMREKIGKLLKEGKKPEATAEALAVELKTDKETLLDAALEIDEYLRSGAPLPTQNRMVLEALDRYLVVHACFGEIVNRTLGGIFDSILSEREAITGWWTDGYRILIETTHKLSKQEIEGLPKELFDLTDERIDEAFLKYVNSKFPFVSRMKAIAERFGAMPRGKTLAMSERGEKLKAAFEGTPIYDETLREAMMDKVDLQKTKQIMRDIKRGKITVSTLARDKPTPLAYHILMQYADTAELMAPERVILSNIDRMKHAIEARTAKLLCMNCGTWTKQIRIKDLAEEPQCENCNSRLLTLLYSSQDADKLKADLQKRREGKELTPEYLKELSNARRKADLILSYGKQAVRALQVKGVGPETASRILGKMHPEEEKFYLDLLKAKIQYLRTREFWDK